jgi:hypothetical protein
LIGLGEVGGVLSGCTEYLTSHSEYSVFLANFLGCRFLFLLSFFSPRIFATRPPENGKWRARARAGDFEQFEQLELEPEGFEGSEGFETCTKGIAKTREREVVEFYLLLTTALPFAHRVNDQCWAQNSKGVRVLRVLSPMQYCGCYGL